MKTVREDQRKAEQAKLETLLLAGLDSSLLEEMPADEWDTLRREVEDKLDAVALKRGKLDWEEYIFPQPATKKPFTRLLDLLAGWSEYAQRDMERGFHDAPDVIDAICGLYQDGGSLSLWEADDREDSATVIRVFLLESVLPTLMRDV